MKKCINLSKHSEKQIKYAPGRSKQQKYINTISWQNFYFLSDLKIDYNFYSHLVILEYLAHYGNNKLDIMEHLLAGRITTQ